MAGIYRTYSQYTAEQFKELTNDQIIESYIPLTIAIAKRFPRKYIAREDAIGIGLLELTRCVNEGEHLEQAQFTHYIQKCVYRKIKGACLRNYGHSVVSSKNRKEHMVTRSLMHTDDLGTLDHGTAEVDLRDIINNVLSRSYERLIVERIVLEGGYTEHDIADEIGCTQQYVNKIKASVLWRVLHELG